jgi:hypothetical protein
MAAVTAQSPIEAHLQAFLATFDAGAKRQGEKNKCLTVLKSSFFKYATDKLIADTALAMEGRWNMKSRPLPVSLRNSIQFVLGQ